MRQWKCRTVDRHKRTCDDTVHHRRLLPSQREKQCARPGIILVLTSSNVDHEKFRAGLSPLRSLPSRGATLTILTPWEKLQL